MARMNPTALFVVLLLCSAVLVACTALLYKNTFALAALFVLFSVLALWVWHEKTDLCSYVLGAVLGSVAEIICIYVGAWTYTVPSVLGIPFWLPFLWGLTVLLMRRQVLILSSWF